MSSNTHTVQLTDLQLSHAIVALQRDLERILSIDSDALDGGEHEDYLIIQSVLQTLKKAKHDKA